MFYYYGRKKLLADKYPEPVGDIIIEPFAGSAAYSMAKNRWQKEVILYDDYFVVVEIWKYLIMATRNDILSLPDLKQGEDLRNINSLSDVEKWLIGFHINPGSPTPKNIVTKMSRWSAGKKYIAENIYKVKHWRVFQSDYIKINENSENITWFIDPPYDKQGVFYVKNSCNINYNDLANFCITRKGRVIVCENFGAGWLPFRSFATTKSCGTRKSVEAIWTNFDNDERFLF